MDSDDAAILGRIARGDQAALGELYGRYRARLFRYLWHQLHGDVALVEEVLQDTLLAVWRAAATWRGEARVATWLFRIAQRCAGHSQRGPRQQAIARQISLSVLDEDDDVPTAAHDDQALDRLALHDALARLAPKQREVVLLIFVQGFTADEVAQILNVPLGTVKSRLHAARAALFADPAIQPNAEVRP
jgi:RNA polymerase sigma factor (sigma-70 family)